MKYYFILIIFFCAFSCKSTADHSKRPCKQLLENDFSQIMYVEDKMVFEAQNLHYNEMRFLCVLSAIYSHKVMFDRYGEWNKEIKTGKHSVNLIWENIDLLGNKELYTIITNGIETKPNHTAFVVFDKDGNDMLSKDSDKRLQFQNFFSNLIRNQNSSKKEFYKKYRATFGI